MTYFEQMRLEEKDLVENTSDRLPVCICVDASYSMSFQNKMHLANQGIRKFIETISSNFYAVDSVEMCIVSFGGTKAKLEVPFSPIVNVEFKDIIPRGSSHLGEAILLSLQNLEARQSQYEEYGISTFKPWLIVISDGNATDSIEGAVARVLQLQREHRLKTMCISLSAQANDLTAFEPNQGIIHLKDFSLGNFFEWLSKSMSQISKASPYEDLELPNMNDLFAIQR